MFRNLVIFSFTFISMSVHGQTNPKESDKSTTTIFPKLEEAPTKSESQVKSSQYGKAPTFTVPFISYNDNDGFGFGGLFMRDIMGVGVIAMPTIGRKSGKLNGNAALIKDFEIKNKNTLRAGLYFRTLSIDNNDKFDYTRRGTSFTPFVEYTLSKDDTLSVQKNRKLSIQPLYVIEEYANFALGDYTGNKASRFFIPSIIYQYIKTSEKRNTSLNFTFEGSQYKTIGANTEHYIKTTLSYDYEYKFHSSYNGWLKLRFFGSGFPINSQRNSSSFQNVFTRGSIALIHQGYNDYSYTQSYLSRQNQNLSYDNQISISQGGGFKTATGSAYNVGLSNNFALAINARVGIPWKLKLPLFGYFDTGVYSVYDRKKYVTKSLTNMGIGAHLGNVVHVFLPVLYSKELGDIHKSQHPEWYQRVSFAIEINNLTKWYKKRVERQFNNFSF